MPRAYSLDLRERVLAASRDERLSQAALAARFRVSEQTVYRWLRRARETGGVAPKPHGGGRAAAVDNAGAAVLRELVDAENDRTLAEYRARYRERTGVPLSQGALWRALTRLGLGRKKKSLSPAEQDRPDVVEARAAFREALAQLAPDALVFVDESGIATDLVRLYGRAPRGRRAVGQAPYGRWERLTILGGLTLGGLTACMSVEGATDTGAFVAFTEHVLVPALHPGQVVVLDNLSPHKAARARELIEAAGCRLLFLPPYSPDFNPIELAWGKLKALLRGLGARTTEALEAALASVVDALTPADARSWFAHCGYGSN